MHEISLFLRKSYFAQILKKILVFAYFVLSYCFVISLNFEKQFQEMMNRFKIKPIRWKLFLLKLIHTNIYCPNIKIFHIYALYGMQKTRAYTGWGRGAVPQSRPVKGGIELRAITLFKSETEEWRILKKWICCFFLLVLFEEEVK